MMVVLMVIIMHVKLFESDDWMQFVDSRAHKTPKDEFIAIVKPEPASKTPMKKQVKHRTTALASTSASSKRKNLDIGAQLDAKLTTRTKINQGGATVPAPSVAKDNGDTVKSLGCFADPSDINGDGICYIYRYELEIVTNVADQYININVNRSGMLSLSDYFKSIKLANSDDNYVDDTHLYYKHGNNEYGNNITPCFHDDDYLCITCLNQDLPPTAIDYVSDECEILSNNNNMMKIISISNNDSLNEALFSFQNGSIIDSLVILASYDRCHFIVSPECRHSIENEEFKVAYFHLERIE